MMVGEPMQPLIAVMGAEEMLSLLLFVVSCPDEVSGLGRIRQLGRRLHLSNLCLLPQTVTPTSSTLDPGGLTEFLVSLVERGEEPAEYRFWWHSHGEEPVFWSDVDERTIAGFGGHGLLSLVLNRRGEFRIRYDGPEAGGTLHDLPLIVAGGNEPVTYSELLERAQGAIAAHVERKRPPIWR